MTLPGALAWTAVRPQPAPPWRQPYRRFSISTATSSQILGGLQAVSTTAEPVRRRTANFGRQDRLGDRSIVELVQASGRSGLALRLRAVTSRTPSGATMSLMRAAATGTAHEPTHLAAARSPGETTLPGHSAVLDPPAATGPPSRLACGEVTVSRVISSSLPPIEIGL